MIGSYSGALRPSQGRKVRAGDLEHHVLEWRPQSSAGVVRAGATGRGVALLLHGYMDVAASWDAVAPRLAERGLHVIAPDLRGFGDAPRAAPGSYYYFSDYIFDVVALVRELAADAPLYVVGHSMGGTVATLYAGAFPERPARLAVLEGLGPPESSFEEAPDRLRAYVEGSLRYRRGPEVDRGMATIDEVVDRLALSHPGVERVVLAQRAPHLVRYREGVGFVWSFDPLHRARSPVPFYAAAFRAFASRITCPVLAAFGGPSGYHPPDEEERLAAFKLVRRETIEDAGHMMHWTRPERVAELLCDFFA